MRRSEEIPFSRSRTWTASTISLDMRSALQQVAAVDLGVGDRHDPHVGGDGDLVVARADQLAREAPAPAVIAARADTDVPADVAPEVVGLRKRTLGTRGADLEARLEQNVAQVPRHAL